MNLVRSWRIALERRDEPTAARLGDGLRLVVAADVVFAAAASEPAPQDLTRPATTATRIEGGWAVNGRKASPRWRRSPPCSAWPSPSSTVVAGTGTASPSWHRDPGVEFHDDWDALGMRASASGSVSFHDVRIGDGSLGDGFTAGSWSAALMERYLVSGAFHAAASLGIAEAAHGHATAALRRRAPRPRWPIPTWSVSWPPTRSTCPPCADPSIGSDASWTPTTTPIGRVIRGWRRPRG